MNLLSLLTFTTFMFFSGATSANWDAFVTDVSNKTGVPKKVLEKVCTHESQSYFNGKRQPWPWTVASSHRGINTSKYFKNKGDAVSYIRSLMRLGIQNIDIGLCQVNWYWHGENFSSVEDLINPENNLLYAAKYLTHHYRKQGVESWSQAIGLYHSPSNPKRAASYTSKVLQ